MADPRLLFALQSDRKVPWGLDFEARPPDWEGPESTLDAWFGKPDWRTSGHRFVWIGQDGTGSLYCLWHYKGLEGEPPMVFFGSEGQLALVADSADSFAQAMADGLTWWPFEGEWRAPYGEPEEDSPSFEAFRAAVEAATGPWSESAAEMLKRARARHPDFEVWVSETAGF